MTVYIVAESGRRSLLSRSGASPSFGCLKLAVRDPRIYNAPLRGGIGQGDWPRGVSNTFTNPSARQGYNPGLNSGGLIAERSVPLLKPLLINPIISTSQKSFYGKEWWKGHSVYESKGKKKKQKLDGINKHNYFITLPTIRTTIYSFTIQQQANTYIGRKKEKITQGKCLT